MDHYASLSQVSEALRRGEVDAVSLTGAMLDRIAAVNPVLNAYLSVDGDGAMEAAETAQAEIDAGRWRGPLHGVPIAIKDLFHTAGTPTTFGSVRYRDYTADSDATIIRRLKQAGAVILGRLHLHEGAFADFNPDLPVPANPWNLDYWPGGSSSGSGSATAAGLCYGALGTDTGGSIRFPSGACGVTGVKTTFGRTSRAGVLPLAPSLDTIGPMCRSAADAAALLGAFAGQDPADPTTRPVPVPDYPGALKGVRGAQGMRIGLDARMLEAVEPEMADAIRAALEVFADLGAEVVPVEMPDLAPAVRAALLITDVECAHFHNAAYSSDPSGFGPVLEGAITRGRAANPLALAGAYQEREATRGRVAEVFGRIDALACPVTPRIGYPYAEYAALFNADLQSSLAFAAPFNLSGNPSVIFPCGAGAAGIPVGMQLVGPHFAEAPLLAAAHAYQQATDWHLRRPPVG